VRGTHLVTKIQLGKVTLVPLASASAHVFLFILPLSRMPKNLKLLLEIDLEKLYKTRYVWCAARIWLRNGSSVDFS
jgi:hypothetical protein